MPKLHKQKSDGFYYIDARDIGAGRYSLSTRDFKLAKERFQTRLDKLSQLSKARPKDRSLKLKEAIRLYVNDKRQHDSPRHADRVEGILTRLEDNLSSSTPVIKVSAAMLRDYFEVRRKQTTRGKPIQPATINKEITCIRAFFKYLQEHGYISSTPADKLRKQKTPRKEAAFLTVDEIKKLLKASEPLFQDIWLTLLHTGLRKSELQNLQVRDVKWNTGQIHVVGKGSKRREIPITADLQPILKRHTEGKPLDDTIFPYHPELRLIFKRRLERAGLDASRYTLHTLRHTFASMLVMGGANLRFIQRVLGHSSINTTLNIYSHLLPEFSEKQMAALESVQLPPQNAQ